MKIHFWDYSKEICAELGDKDGTTFTIDRRGDFTIESDVAWSGTFYKFIPMYDLCFLLALWGECYGSEGG